MTSHNAPEALPLCLSCGRRQGWNGHPYRPCGRPRLVFLATDPNGKTWWDLELAEDALELKTILEARGWSCRGSLDFDEPARLGAKSLSEYLGD